MYVTMKEILTEADKGNYAVIAANCINEETARAIITAAEEKHSPVIVNLGQGHMLKHANGEYISFMVRDMAGKAKVPVALNLDHGKEFYKIAMAVQYRFSSVMIDASVYSLEENIARTKEVINLAHPLGITVEAELGHVGEGSEYSSKDPSKLFTDPDEAVYFVKETGVDALAVAIGTAHGVYAGTPKIDFERLKQLKAALKMPLVLHGGSGSGDENLHKASQLGINKINICTDLLTAFKNSVESDLKNNPKIDYLTLMMNAEQAGKRLVMYYIDLFGSANKA